MRPKSVASSSPVDGRGRALLVADVVAPGRGFAVVVDLEHCEVGHRAVGRCDPKVELDGRFPLVKIAFEVGRAALARPLRPDSTVLIVSSSAGVNVNG